MDPAKKFEAGETVLIFDELQEFPEIATSLKFFKTDGRFDVICSGSLLGNQYKRIESHSVGYKTDYNMMSMDFEEFLWAKGYSSRYRCNSQRIIRSSKSVKWQRERVLKIIVDV